ncbi:MAG: PLP-dependent transferase [Phycisphaerae bacterium]|jgi:O-acetylhomoserine/O-acetylserine sulfhydrylase-like pyridoxal-dependent enzyme
MKFDTELSRFGVKTVFADPTDASAFEAVLTKRTKMIFVESICTPSLDVPDFDGISEMARKARIPFVVDNTVATPARPSDEDIKLALTMDVVCVYYSVSGRKKCACKKGFSYCRRDCC